MLTYFAYRASLRGGRAFHWSFSAIGMSTSLTSGLPSRATCFQGPWPTYLPCRESQTFDFLRLDVAQTPIVALAATALGSRPSRAAP